MKNQFPETGVVLWYDEKNNHGAIKGFNQKLYYFSGYITPKSRVVFTAVYNSGDLFAMEIRKD